MGGLSEDKIGLFTTEVYYSNYEVAMQRNSLWWCYGWFGDRSRQLFSNTVTATKSLWDGGEGPVREQTKHTAWLPSVPAGWGLKILPHKKKAIKLLISDSSYHFGDVTGPWGIQVLMHDTSAWHWWMKRFVFNTQQNGCVKMWKMFRFCSVLHYNR